MSASAVLNASRTTAHFSAETRQRILAAAEELRYRPNLAARSLAQRRIQTIGVAAVMEGGELNHYFLEIFSGILAAAARHDQSTTVFALHAWQEDAASLYDLCDGRIDGLVLLAPTFGRRGARPPAAHTPFVSVHANHLSRGIVNIESDEEAGAFALVNHLIALGHRRIMHLTGPAGLTGAERRIRGYKQALAGAQLPFERHWLVTGGYTSELGREAMRTWLRQFQGRPLPQAVFCANDAAALGCIEALAEVGLRVPGDVSVAGFDDTLAARSVVPQLTSVRQPLHEMGTCAVERLLALINHPVVASDAVLESVVFPVTLALRASVGAPPGSDRLAPSCRADGAAACAGRP